MMPPAYESSITRKSRLLCPHCDALRGVADVGFDTSGRTVVTLKDCGHTRGELLPLKAGRISLEHLSGKPTTIGLVMFPVCKGAFYE